MVLFPMQGIVDPRLLYFIFHSASGHK